MGTSLSARPALAAMLMVRSLCWWLVEVKVMCPAPRVHGAGGPCQAQFPPEPVLVVG